MIRSLCKTWANDQLRSIITRMAKHSIGARATIVQGVEILVDLNGKPRAIG